MRATRSSTILVLLVVLLTGPQIATAGDDPVHVGLYSDEWDAGLDLRNLGAVGGARVTFGGTFHRLDESAANTLHILEQVWSAEATPVANLEIFSSSRDIAAGFRDRDIRAWASNVQTWLDYGDGRSLLIAPMAEMNGDWVPWGMDPSTYPDAFRRIVTTFREMGMDETQVRWIWAPNSVSSWPYAMTSYWPGSDHVDLVGMSAYNLGGEPDDWQSAYDAMFQASQVLRTVARDKPFLITQIGSSPEGGEKDEWISEMFDFIADDANMVGFVYFNFDKEANWKVWDGFEVTPGWIEAVERHNVRHVWPISEWFQPGELPIRLEPKPKRIVRPAFIGADFVDGVYVGPRGTLGPLPE